MPRNSSPRKYNKNSPKKYNKNSSPSRHSKYEGRSSKIHDDKNSKNV